MLFINVVEQGKSEPTVFRQRYRVHSPTSRSALSKLAFRLLQMMHAALTAHATQTEVQAATSAVLHFESKSCTLRPSITAAAHVAALTFLSGIEPWWRDSSLSFADKEAFIFCSPKRAPYRFLSSPPRPFLILLMPFFALSATVAALLVVFVELGALTALLIASIRSVLLLSSVSGLILPALQRMGLYHSSLR